MSHRDRATGDDSSEHSRSSYRFSPPTSGLEKGQRMNPEHLAQLKEGVGLWNHWRKSNELSSGLPYPPIDLGRTNLRDVDLHGADLRYVNLRGTCLLRANL